MAAAAATSRARHGRSTTTRRTGSPAEAMASRMVPLPEASTPIRADRASVSVVLVPVATGPRSVSDGAPGAESGDAPGPTRARYQRRRVPTPARPAALPGVSGVPVLLSPDIGTGATWPDRPASGIRAHVARSPLPRECPS